MRAQTFILNYVNDAENTFDYDREYKTLAELADFVLDTHPNATSYQIVVIMKKGEITNAG